MQLIVRHGIEDYDTWRRAFDGDVEARGQASLTLLQIWRDLDDRRSVWLLYEVHDRKRAEAYFDGLAQVHARQSGVTATDRHYLATA